MGLKSRAMKAPLPRCFQVSCVHIPSEEAQSKANRKTIKLITTDGDVKIYDKPVRAMELMQEFPKHMVCRSDSFYLGQKTLPLSQNEKLQLGSYYFLLPTNFFQSALSFSTLIRCRTAFTGKGSPFEVVKTPSGSLRIKVFEEMLVKNRRDQLFEEADDDGYDQRIGRVCTTPQLRKDYEMLVVRRQWKPKLDIIKEKKKSGGGGKKTNKEEAGLIRHRSL